MDNERIIPTPKPSDRPSFTIRLDGQELSREYHVMSIVVTKLVNKISYAKLILSDGDPACQDFPMSAADLFVPGKTIEILAGYHSKETSIFQGIVIKHGIKTRQSKFSSLVVECKHQAVKLSVGRKNAYYYDSTDSDVFETILGQYSIAKDIEPTKVTHKKLVQYEATDWDFILSRAEVNGMLVFTNDKKIIIKKPDFSPKPSLSLLYGATILEFDAEMDVRNQLSSVNSQSWDMAKQEILEAEAEAPQLPAQGNIDASSLADVIGLKQFTMFHSGLLSDQELKVWADAQLLKSRMSRIRGRVKFIGYADINPGDLLGLQGVGNRFNGNVFVSGIRHELSEGFWTTDAQFGVSPDWFIEESHVSSKPASGLLPAINGLQIGVVTQLQDDPDKEDRVRVRMPLIDQQAEGIWTRVASLDAGENRGAFFRPEIGDEVVLGFLNDDPRDPIILGMLNSSAKPAPITASDDNHEKGFVTRSAMKLLFHDEKKSITIETPNGNIITLSDDAGSIVLEDENGNKIEMNADGISIKSVGAINIKASKDVTVEGANINANANSQFKAMGASGAELSTSATAVVKGSLVQIN